MKLRKSTIKAYKEASKELNDVDLMQYANDLISELYAPCFADLAGYMLNIPAGTISAEDSCKIMEIEEQLEKEWWENVGDQLIENLLEIA